MSLPPGFKDPLAEKKFFLWALMQTHQYGSSIVAEVLAPNKATASSLFDKDLGYLSEPNGTFTISRLFLPTPIPPEITGYKDRPIKPRSVRLVRGVTVANGGSPFLPKGMTDEEFYGSPIDYSKIPKGPIPLPSGVFAFTKSAHRHLTKSRQNSSGTSSRTSEKELQRKRLSSSSVRSHPSPVTTVRPPPPVRRTSRFSTPVTSPRSSPASDVSPDLLINSSKPATPTSRKTTQQKGRTPLRRKSDED